MIKSNIKSTVIQLRVTPKTKKMAQKILGSKGLTLSNAVDNFLNNLSLHEDALMLAYDQPKISAATIKRWESEIIHELNNVKRFNSSKEAIKHLKLL
jgi:antitoxin component of RelBE/YafQ-DinJ toxin-antitoxin module